MSVGSIHEAMGFILNLKSKLDDHSNVHQIIRLMLCMSAEGAPTPGILYCLHKQTAKFNKINIARKTRKKGSFEFLQFAGQNAGMNRPGNIQDNPEIANWKHPMSSNACF